MTSMNDAPASTAPAPPEPRPRSALGRFLREYVLPVVLVLGFLAPVRSAVADWNDVPSGSMRPSILEGDRIFVDKLAYGLRVPFTTRWFAQWDGPRRGDVVTLASPQDGTRLVKRVVGIPGDRIAMSGNRLVVNGEPVSYRVERRDAEGHLPDGRPVRVSILEEQLPGHAHPLTLTPGIASRRSFPEVRVPEDSYFVMGDNRDLSEDSRFFGFVARDLIYGRVTHVALSFDPDHHAKPRFARWFQRMP